MILLSTAASLAFVGLVITILSPMWGARAGWTGTVMRSAQIDGRSYNSSVSLSSAGKIGFSLTGNLALAGTLSTRTDNNTGVLTVASGHGITASDFVDVTWLTGGGGSRRRMDVTAVTATTISIDLGTGDNLPTLLDAVVVCKTTEKPFSVVGDQVDAILITVPCAGIVTFIDGAGPPAELDSHVFTTAGSYIWTSLDGVTNPLAGDVVVTVTWSQQDATLAAGQEAAGELLY